MRVPTMQINKSELWWCSQNAPKNYAAPVKLYANVMPTNSDGDIQMYGAAYPEYLRIKGDLNSDLSQIGEGDRIFFRKEPPTTHDVSQTTKTAANFFVSSIPVISMSTVSIDLKRIVDR